MALAQDPATRRREHLTLPLTESEMADIETVAAAWGRKKTEFARDLLLSALRSLPPPAPLQPLPGAAS